MVVAIKAIMNSFGIVNCLLIIIINHHTKKFSIIVMYLISGFTLGKFNINFVN